MTRFQYVLIHLVRLQLGAEAEIEPETPIGELYKEGFGDPDWVEIMIEYELIMGREIPDEIGECMDISLEEFASAVEALPEIPSEAYPEFLAIKLRLIDAAFRNAVAEGGQGTDLSREEVVSIRADLEEAGRCHKEFLERVIGWVQ
jgi:hypothetical protein